MQVTAIGAVLGKHYDKETYVVYYASKMLKDAQINYMTMQKSSLQ